MLNVINAKIQTVLLVLLIKLPVLLVLLVMLYKPTRLVWLVLPVVLPVSTQPNVPSVLKDISFPLLLVAKTVQITVILVLKIPLMILSLLIVPSVPQLSTKTPILVSVLLVVVMVSLLALVVTQSLSLLVKTDII